MENETFVSPREVSMVQKTILIVDDSLIVLETARALFGSTGHNVVTHAEGFGMLSKVLEVKPNLIILDLDMPVIGGEKMVQTMRRILENRLPPILFHSSADEDELKRAVQRNRVTGYVKKGDSAKLLTEACKLL